MLSDDITRYVEFHRSLGYKYRLQDGLLRNFARFAEPRGDLVVRSQTALDWAAEAPSANQCRNRLCVVRRFARQMRAEGLAYEVPPEKAFGRPTTGRRMP